MKSYTTCECSAMEELLHCRPKHGTETMEFFFLWLLAVQRSQWHSDSRRPIRKLLKCDQQLRLVPMLSSKSPTCLSDVLLGGWGSARRDGGTGDRMMRKWITGNRKSANRARAHRACSFQRLTWHKVKLIVDDVVIFASAPMDGPHACSAGDSPV
jgi:hypothetical protein